MISAEPGQYQHLLRGPRFAWWRSLLALVLALAFMVGAFGLLEAVATLLGFAHLIDGLLAEQQITPAGFGFGNLALATLIPACMLANRIMHGKGAAGRLSSVAGRIRWRWLLRCMALVAPVFAVYIGIDLLLDPPESGMHPQWALLVLLIIVSTPLQAAGEEYIARGLILQNVGGFFSDPRRAAVVAAVPCVLVFAAAHGSRDPWILLDLAIFGAACTVLAVRTGGLEAPIALHAMNNAVGMIITALAGGWAEAFVAESSTGHPVEPVLTLMACALAVPLILRQARRDGIRRTFDPPPASAAAGQSPSATRRRPVAEALALLFTLLVTIWLVWSLIPPPQ